MLVNLSIKNYILIKEMLISFDNNFTTITGETGAGKSILIGALGLVLGERSDSNVLLNNEKKCIIEVEFNIQKYNLEDFFEQNDLDYLDNSVIRREINSVGRSRAFINDTPVTLSQLKKLGVRLVDINSQHQMLLLNESNFQLKVVDAFCNHNDLLDSYHETYNKLEEKKILLSQLESQELSQQNDKDYKRFLLDELKEIEIKNEKEFTFLEEELKILENSKEIKYHLEESIHLIDGIEDHSIISNLQNLKNILNIISKDSEKISNLLQRVNVVNIELKDIHVDLESFLTRIQNNPEKLSNISRKIEKVNTLLLKHRFNNFNDLLKLKNDLSKDLENIDSLKEKINSLKDEVKDFYIKANDIADEISKNRMLVIPQIENKISKLLISLGIKNARIAINILPLRELFFYGKEKVSFNFSANKGNELKEISSIASGGELSRLMLCIKYLIASANLLPTIIFDEIDSGISGEIANKMGLLMKEMGNDIQVISITHLPQVAAKGNSQMLVKKIEKNNLTETKIVKLKDNERIIELAKMLSGEKITESSLLNAKELLN